MYKIKQINSTITTAYHKDNIKIKIVTTKYNYYKFSQRNFNPKTEFEEDKNIIMTQAQKQLVIKLTMVFINCN